MPFVVPSHPTPVSLAGRYTADSSFSSSNKKNVADGQPIGRSEPGSQTPLQQYLKDFDYHQNFLVHPGKDVWPRAEDTAENLKRWEDNWRGSE